MKMYWSAKIDIVRRRKSMAHQISSMIDERFDSWACLASFWQRWGYRSFFLTEFFRLRSLLSINILTTEFRTREKNIVIFSDKLHSIVLIEFVENKKIVWHTMNDDGSTPNALRKNRNAVWAYVFKRNPAYGWTGVDREPSLNKNID